MRDSDRVDLARAQRRDDVGDRQRSRSIDVANAGGILADEPERLEDCLVPRENHDAASCHSPHLGKTSDRIRPVMHCEDSERGVDGAIGERQTLRRPLNDWRGARGPLADHRDGAFHRDDHPVAGLVRPGAGIHVHGRRRVAKRVDDPIRDTRVGEAGSPGQVERRCNCDAPQGSAAAMFRVAAQRNAGDAKKDE